MLERLLTLKESLNSLGFEFLIKSLPPELHPLFDCCELTTQEDKLLIKVIKEFPPDLPISKIADKLYSCRHSILEASSTYFFPEKIVILCGSQPYHVFSSRENFLRTMTQGANGTITVLNEIQQRDLITLDSLINWMRVQTVPLSLTPNDTNITGYVNQAYADFTQRSQAEWLGDIGNGRRFPEGELGRIIKSLKSAKNQLITDFQFTAEVWNLPGIPYYWYGDAKEIVLNGRSFRLLHTKHREQKAVMV